MPQLVQPRRRRRRGSVPSKRARRLVQLRPPEPVTPLALPHLRSLQPQLSAVRSHRMSRTQQQQNTPVIQQQQQSNSSQDNCNRHRLPLQRLCQTLTYRTGSYVPLPG